MPASLDIAHSRGREALNGVDDAAEMFPARKRPKGFERPKDYIPVPLNEHIALSQQPFWKELPDILQAQVMVMMEMAKRPKGPGWKLPKGEVETLLWAGTPHVRTRVLLQIFCIWSVLLVIPAFVLVEAVPDEGGVLALCWAFLPFSRPLWLAVLRGSPP